MDFDSALKIECIRIAANEQLELESVASMKKILKRAKDFYRKAYEEDISNWNNFNNSKPEKQTEPKKEQETVSNIKRKLCPKCGESIPESWISHNYTSKGQRCGYKWG